MKNDPLKYESQTWTMPRGALALCRTGMEWYLTDFTGQVRISVDGSMGRLMSNAWTEVQEEEDWIYRHSLQFRWLRFWYKRKKRREARLQR